MKAEHAVDRADHLRALQRHGDLELALDLRPPRRRRSRAPRRPARPRRRSGRANRRTRSRLSAGAIATPGVSAGTRNWVSVPVDLGGHQEPVWLRRGLDRTLRRRRGRSLAVARGRRGADRLGDPAGRPARPGTRWPVASPVRSPGRTLGLLRRSEPDSDSAAATTLVGTSGPGETRRPISSATSTRSSSPCPETLPPPCSSDTSSDVQPSSAPRRHQSSGKPAGCFSAHSRTVESGQVLSRYLRVVSLSSS